MSAKENHTLPVPAQKNALLIFSAVVVLRIHNVRLNCCQ